MPEVQIRFEGCLIRETAGCLLGTPPRFHTYERTPLLLLPMPGRGCGACQKYPRCSFNCLPVLLCRMPSRLATFAT
jgi:hypothetical protein